MSRSEAVDFVVECYSGYRLNERPLRLHLPQGTVVVSKVLRRWYTEEHSCFLVLGEDGQTYSIRWSEELDLWELEPSPA